MSLHNIDHVFFLRRSSNHQCQATSSTWQAGKLWMGSPKVSAVSVSEKDVVDVAVISHVTVLKIGNETKETSGK